VYEASGPLAPFQQLGGMDLRRLQSTLSGPNQAGLWLLIPWTITLLGVFKNFKLKPILLFGLFDIALFLTFSRSAWVAAFVIFLILLWQHRNQYYPVIQKLLKKILWAAGITSVCVVLIASVLRPDSTRDHIQKPMAAIAEIIRYPLGQGLGAAGPASNRVNDTCLTFNAGADVTWAQAHPDLCIFVNNKQVQPEAACSCPNLPENWYLQMGIEFGLLGFVLWILLLWFILKERFKIWFISLPFLGVCIASMFLHSWESSAVMITMWLLIAASFYKSDSSSL
jgi:O-antigen ligase